MNKPRLAVFKFASCDGCQLSLLACEDELLDVAERVHIANFPEASRNLEPGPYDIGLVEGSITTAHDAERIREVRAQCKILVAIGACATAGGIQALRNFADLEAFKRAVYPQPEVLDCLATSTAIADHVPVDLELRGCPVNKAQLVDALLALLHGRRPNVSPDPVCRACKLGGAVCVMVARGIPCLGPVTHAGCDAICPRFGRGCFGCFGPSEQPQIEALAGPLSELDRDAAARARRYQTFNAAAPPFREGRRLALLK